jgi:hypothetical protein
MGFPPHHRFPPMEPEAPVSPRRRGFFWALNYPAKFLGFVVSYGPCTGEKISQRDTSIFVALKIDCDQP